MWVSGRVQGVCFRAATSKKARELGIKGLVRNLTSGQVEVIAEGSGESLDDLILWCHKGPDMAMVVDVKVNIEPYNGNFLSFSIGW